MASSCLVAMCEAWPTHPVIHEAAFAVTQKRSVSAATACTGATRAFSVYMTATQAIMSPEQFRRFGQMLAANPVLNAMLGRVQSDGTTDVPGSAQDPPSEPKSTVLCPSVVMEESQPSSP